MRLIVGLGNPGRIYAHNRHNIGFICLNHFAKTQGIRFDKKQGQARVGTGAIAGDKTILARPQTGMNLSGQSVSRLVKKFNIDRDDILIIHDDLDLPLGKIRIRHSSSPGGHKGVDSIITHLGSRDFSRIRVGIGRPTTIEDSIRDKEAAVVNYVLSGFAPGEEEIIARVIPEVSEAILCILNEGLTAAMNKYN
ncbi:aminoacyl-tRNA hydrolase [Chloroflexota bacterium]